MRVSERLEEIKEHFAYCMDEGLLFAEQEEKLLEELYEQAERVDMLIHENMEIRKGYQERSKRVQELEREFELCDSTIHMIDMTINNPSTSDDDKFEKVNTIIKKYYADGCIHCNSKGFNGLDYCPNCIRGKVIQKNMELEQQNKRYREALEQIKKEETVTTALPEGQKAYTASGHIARKALESESE